MNIKILAIDGQFPTEESIIAGNAPMRRELNLVYQEMTEPMQKLLDMVNSPRGADVFRELGLIPVSR